MLDYLDGENGNPYPNAYRLHCRRDFQSVREMGRKRHTPHFIVLVLEKTCGPTRLGLTVSRKVGGAVQRNRVKRWVREFFRTRYSQLPLNSDISIIAKRGAPDLGYARVCNELEILT